MNLSQIIQRLREAGLSEQSIAELAGTSQPTIHRIRTEAQEASYRIGKALERLYDEYCKDVERSA